MSNLPPPTFGPPGGPVGPGGQGWPGGPGGSSGSSVPAPPPPHPPPPPAAPAPPSNGFRRGTPGGPGDQPLPYTATQPRTPGGSKRIIVIAAVVVAVAIAAAVVVVLVNDSDSKNSSDTSLAVATTAPTTATAVSVTEAPVTTAAATTTAPPQTTVAPETSTTVPAIPADAIDLGHGVYIPIPAGWTQTNSPGAAVTLSDGTTSVAAQVLARTPGENPATLMQEYVDTFDTDFETVSYGPTANIRRLDGEPAVDVYNTFYLTYDVAADFGLSGAVNAYIRGDGLSLIYDVYGPSTATGSFPTDAADTMRLSLQHAPLLKPLVALVPVAAFRVSSVHPFVQVDGLTGFCAAPGFTIFTAGNNRGLVTNGTEDFQVDKLLAQPDTNAVTASAQSVIGENYTGVSFTELTLSDPDPYGIVHGSFGWTGTYVGGNPSAGEVDFYFDPATQNAYSVLRAWFTGADNSEPFPAHGQFMLHSMFNGFTTIP